MFFPDVIRRKKKSKSKSHNVCTHTFCQTQKPIPPFSLALSQSQIPRFGHWVMMMMVATTATTIKTSQV